MSVRSTLLRTFAKLGLLFGLFFLFFWLLLYTQLGVRWVIGSLNTLTPWHISYSSSHGHFAGPLSFESLELDSPDFKLSVQDLQVDWTIWSLLHGTLSLNTVMMSEIVYTPAETQNNEAVSLEDIQNQLSQGPVRFKIKSFVAKDILLNTHDTPIQINTLSFTKADTKKKSLVKTLVLEGGFGHFSVLAEEDFNLSFDLAIADLSQWSKQLSGDFRGHGVMVIADLNEPIKTTDFSMSFESKHMSIGDHDLNKLKVSAHGSLENSTANIQGVVNQHDINLSMSAHYHAPQWRLDIKPSQWHHPKYGDMPKIDGFITLNQLDVMQGQLAINLLEGNQLKGQYRIDAQKDYALEGALEGDFNDFSIINRFFPQLGKTTGQAKLNIQLSGSVFEPVVRGSAELTQLYMPLADMGTDLHIEQLNLSNTRKGILDMDGHGRLGDGPFHVKGRTDFNGEQPDVQIHLSGENMVLSRTPEYFVVADPDMTFMQKQGENRIYGQLFISEADIQMDSVDNFVPVSSDVIIVQDKQSPKPEKAPSNFGKLKTDITIQLGDKVQFKGYNLKTNLQGKLNIKGNTGEPTLATGKIQLKDGQYKTRGKTLSITHGQLTWAGSPLSNPALDVKGQREVHPVNTPTSKSDDIFQQKTIHHGPMMVGVSLSGTLKAPQLRLFSQPQLNEGDVLSYLLLDKPQASASITEGKILYEAANELIFHFGSKTTDLRPSLVERFNLDRLELASNPKPGQGSSFQDTVLIIGKQFSSRLYAEYTLGILDSASAVHLRYLVGKHITLETSASKNQVSADLLFIFEDG